MGMGTDHPGGGLPYAVRTKNDGEGGMPTRVVTCRSRALVVLCASLAALHRGTAAPRLPLLLREDEIRLPRAAAVPHGEEGGARGEPAVPMPALYRPEPPPASMAHKERHKGSLSAAFPPLSSGWTAGELIKAWERLRATGPAVPFYIQDDAWGKRMDAAALIARFRRCKVVHTNQYASDVHFLVQLERHRWRVARPSSARFIVVPAAIGMAANSRCRAEGAVARALEYVQSTELWSRRRADYLFVALHWSVRPKAVPGLPESKWVGYRAGKYSVGGHRQPWIMAPYNDAGFPAPPPLRTSRNVTFFFGGRTLAAANHPGYHVRDSLRQRRGTLFTTAGLPGNNIFVDVSGADRTLPGCDPARLANATKYACRGRYDEAPLMRRSRFTINVRGDQPGTNRLERCVEHGSVCVAVSDRVYYVGESFQCFVPYEHMVAEAGEVAFKCNPGRSLLHVLHEWPLWRRQRARELMRHFARDILWRAPGSRVAENVLLEAAATFAPSKEAAVLQGRVPCGFRNRLMSEDFDNATDTWLRTTRVVSNRVWPCPRE